MAIAGSFYEWIQRPDTHKIYLADLNLVRQAPVTGTPETLPFSYGTEYFVPPPGTVTEYDGLLGGIPRYSRRIQEVFSGQSFPSFGPAILYNDRGTLDVPFRDYLTKDQVITFRLGGPPDELRYGDFGTVLTGIMGPQILRDAEVEIPVFDDQRRLRRKIPTATFTATDFGVNFPSGSEGRSIPTVYGEVHNFQPVETNTSTLEWTVAGHPCSVVGTVYDNDINITSNATINLNNAKGQTSFTLSSRPAGLVTCDVRGRSTQAGTYTDRLGGIIEALLRQEAGFNANKIDNGTMSTFKSDMDFPVGIAVTEPKEILDVIDELIAGLLVFYGMSREGTFQINKFKDPSPGPAKLELSFAEDIEIRDPFELHFSDQRWRVQLGYDNNETVQNDSSVAGSVTEQRRAWSFQPFRTVVASDQSIKDMHNYAEEEEIIITRLIRRSDAQTAANERLAILGTADPKKQRHVISAPFGVQPTVIDLGDIVNLQRDRYSISGFYRVIGIEENYLKSEVNLELWR